MLRGNPEGLADDTHAFCGVVRVLVSVRQLLGDFEHVVDLIFSRLLDPDPEFLVKLLLLDNLAETLQGVLKLRHFLA